MRVKILKTRPAPSSVFGLLMRALRGQRSSKLVERRQIPYWQERGWTRQGNCYSGAYQTRYGSYCGSIEDRGARNFNFLIYQPPEVLQRGSHWNCFRDQGQGWYLVHMRTQPGDVSAGILVIERLITEAFQKQTGTNRS